MKFFSLIAFVVNLAFTQNSAFGATPLEFTLTSNPRVEWIQDRDETESARGHLGLNSSLKAGSLQAYVEGFGEYDLQKDLANLRRSQSDVLLQEAYLEYKFGPLLVRAGRQPVRWSESWTLPSLDLWTARYYNRLFFDPVAEQLVHPTGVLFTLGDPKKSLSVFENLVPAQNQYPEPLPQSSSQFSPQLGVRGKIRLDSGFDVSAIYANQSSLVTYGASVSYALDQAVPKIEAGSNNAQGNFATLGSDIFIDEFTLLPQLTYYKVADASPLLGNSGYSWLAYAMIRWTKDPHEIDLQGFYDQRESGQFISLHYSYQFRAGPLLEIYAQNYGGMTGSLFGLYQQITHSDVAGVRLGITF